MSHDRRVHRFAIYGRSRSGKTCLLSAMAMAHLPHPLGHSCTRVPYSPHSGERRSEEEQERLRRGDAWLDDAIQALQDGELPRPNQVSDFVMTFRFEIGAADRRAHLVELVDYSGELVNPRDLADADSLASRLREHLSQMDGVFVLAEAPAPDERERLSDELRLLREAFIALRGEQQSGPVVDTPVVLLITKWDRQSSLESDPNPTREADALEAFFESAEHAEYRGLRDALRNGVAEGSFQAYPVSAFGKVESRELDHGKWGEWPAEVSPLPSFGLEDPFLWAIGRCDELALAECIEEERTLSWWRPSLRGDHGRVASRAAGLARQLPRGSAEHAAARRLVRRCRAKRAIRGVVSTLSLGAAWLLSEAVWDNTLLARSEAVLNNPEAPSAEVRQVERWLESYATSPVYRHPVTKRVVSPEEIADRLSEGRRRRCERDWERVLDVEDVLARATAAAEHRSRFPTSPFLDDALRVEEEASAARESRENAAWWSQLESTAQQALELADANALQAAQTSLDAPPHPARETSDEHARRTELRRQVGVALGEVAARAEWSEFLGRYESLMAARQHLEAGSLLASRVRERGVDDASRALAESFQRQLAESLPQQVATLVRESRWEEAYEVSRRLERELTQWPEELCPEEPTRFGRELRRTIDVGRDRQLYDRVVRYRTTDAARAYVEQAPLGAMRREVERLAQWLDARSRPFDVTFVVRRINWGSRAQGANDNRIVVEVNGQRIECSKVISAANTRTDLGGRLRLPIKVSLQEDLRVSLRIVEVDLFSNDDHGESGEQSILVTDLLRDYSLPLRSPKYYHEAVLAIEGVPAEPLLPPWRAD